MKLETSALIGKISKLKRKPALFSGYLKSKGDKKILLYPELDPRSYYVIETDCIIDIFPTEHDKRGHVTLLVDPSCEIECVAREYILATDLESSQSKWPCNCKPSDDPNIVFAKKDEARQAVIAIAKFLIDNGITELDCTRTFAGSSAAIGCCQAWNRLLRAIADGGNVFNAANGVLSHCFGIG